MKRLAALLLLGGVAHAAPIAPPAGWTLDPTLATPPTSGRFGGATTKVAVYAYRAPAPGAVLYVNRAEAEVPAEQRDRIASLELAEPRNTMTRQTGATTLQDSQRFDPSTKQLEAAVSWKDATVHDTSRIVIASDATHVVAVTGQCVLAIDAPAELATACDAALATLDPEVPKDQRVALTIVSGAQPTPEPTMAEPSLGEPPPKLTPDTLNDGHDLKLPPIVLEPPKPETDRRPVYLGAGLVVLAVVFYWNRRRRETFERESEDVPKKPRARDEDADDLHAAAEAGDDGDRT